MEEKSKKCSKCLLTLLLSEFNHRANSKDGHRAECRCCEHAFAAQYEQARLYARKYNLFKLLETRLNGARTRARRKKLAFNITVEHLLALYLNNPLCAYTDMPFVLGDKDMTISVDKINPALGYIISNVRLVWWAVNKALGDSGDGTLDKIGAARAVKLRNEISSQEQNVDTILASRTVSITGPVHEVRFGRSNADIWYAHN